MADHFFIIGAQRCGTTALYHALDGHPAITMARPVKPEPRFFLRTWRWPKTASEYDTLFPGAGRAEWLGEKSTSYIEHPECGLRIRGILPDARIIAVLRDPIERAISNYRFSRMNGLECLPIEEALEREKERLESKDQRGCSVSPFAYAARGRYADYLEPFRQAFPASQRLFITLESLRGNRQTLSSVFTFLGLAVPAEGNYTFERMHASEGPGVVLSAPWRNRLKEYYRDSNRRLADDYGVDISCWTSAHER